MLTDELKAARSGQASAYPDFRIDDDGPFVPLTGKDSQNPEMAVKWLRSENDRLKHALRKLQDEVSQGKALARAIADEPVMEQNEQLRAAAVLQPQMWTEPEQHFQVIDSKVGAIRRSGSFQHHAHAPIQARRGSVSASQHSRVSSYSSSYASHLTGASSASSYAQQGQHPSLSLDFSQIRPAFPHHHSADVYTRPRSQSAASDWTTLSSPAGSAHSRQGSLSAGAGGQSYGLGLAQYMSSLPTVPGSATIPAESFADIQVNSRSESLPGHLANRLTMEGPTPTIASNANWRAAQAQAMLAGGSGGGGQAMLSASQYASYPSALPLYRTQGSAPEVYADQAILTPGGVMPRPATALPVQTVYSGPESGTITPEELLGQVVTSSSGPNEQDVAVP